MYIPESKYLSPEDKAKVSPIPWGFLKYALWLIVFTKRNAADIGALIGVSIVTVIAAGSIWGNTASIVTATSLLMTLILVETIARLVHSNVINPDLRNRILGFQDRYELSCNHGHSILLHKCVSKDRTVSDDGIAYDIFEGAYSTDKVPECRCHTAYLRLHLRQYVVSRRLVHLEHETASSMSIIEGGHNVEYERDPDNGTHMLVFVDLGGGAIRNYYSHLSSLLSAEFMAYELTGEWFVGRSSVIAKSHNHIEAQKRDLAEAKKNALDLAIFWIERSVSAINSMRILEEEARKTNGDRPSRALRDLRKLALETEQHLIVTGTTHSPFNFGEQTRTDVELFREYCVNSCEGRLVEIKGALADIERLNNLDKQALEKPEGK